MKASRFSDAQKAFILKQGSEGMPVADNCRKAGISQATYFYWKRKYDGLLPTEMRRLKQLEDENSKLRKVVADLSLDKEKLQDVISAAPATPSDSSLRNGATAAPETRFELAATAQQGRASGAGGTIRLASRRGGQLPCHAGAGRRWRP